MTTNEQARRKAEAAQKAVRALNLIRAGGLILVGVVGLIATVSGTLFANAGSGQSQGWLYDNLGKDGATAAAVGLFALITIAGVLWVVRIYRGLRGG